MERGWERTLPVIRIERKIIEELFRNVLKGNEIKEISLIDEGCRTTNYLIKSIFDKKYILKIFYEKSDSYKREIQLFEKLSDIVPVSHIYKFDKSHLLEEREYIIYSYLEGETLSAYIQKGNKLNSRLVTQAAVILAGIHNNKYSKVGFLNEKLDINQEVPPLIKWYEMFMGDNASKKLGTVLKQKILNIVNMYKNKLIELDNTVSLVHGDFQGTNILINKNNISGILDWEFCMAGHPIADIGQFFRYDKCFDSDLLKIFQDEYNRNSEYKLENDWYKIAKLRDLTNLIQLLDKDGYMPKKDKDIINLIINSLKQLEYM